MKDGRLLRSAGVWGRQRWVKVRVSRSARGGAVEAWVSATDGRRGGSLRFDGINVQYAHLGSGADGREWRVPCSRKDRVKPVMTSHSSLLSRSRDASSMRRVIARVDCWVPSAGLFVAASKVGGAGVLADNLPSQLMEAREAPGTIVRVFAAARSSISLLSSRPVSRQAAYPVGRQRMRLATDAGHTAPWSPRRLRTLNTRHSGTSTSTPTHQRASRPDSKSTPRVVT